MLHRFALLAGFGLILAARSAPAAPASSVLRKLYVDNTAGETVSVIDLNTRKRVKEIAVGRHPHGLSAAPDQALIYVSVESQNAVMVIETASDTVVGRIATSGRPNQSALTPDGRFLYVAIQDKGTADVIDTAQRKVVKSLRIGRYPHNCYCPPGGKHVYVTSVDENLVDQVDYRHDHTITETVHFDGHVRPLAVTRDEKRLFVAIAGVHGFAWADLTSGREIDTVRMPLPPKEKQSKFAYMDTHGLELTPDNRELWVTSFRGNGLMVFDITGPKPRYVTTVAVGDAPNWLTFSPDGRFAYSANAGANSISIVDVAARRALAEIPVGPVPKRLLEVHPPVPYDSAALRATPRNERSPARD